MLLHEIHAMSSKVFIITGASKGIGAAIAKYLLSQSHKVVVTARSSEPLEALKKSHPEQVQFITGDMVDVEASCFALCESDREVLTLQDRFLPNWLISPYHPLVRLMASWLTTVSCHQRNSQTQASKNGNIFTT